MPSNPLDRPVVFQSGGEVAQGSDVAQWVQDHGLDVCSISKAIIVAETGGKTDHGLRIATGSAEEEGPSAAIVVSAGIVSAAPSASVSTVNMMPEVVSSSASAASRGDGNEFANCCCVSGHYGA